MRRGHPGAGGWRSDNSRHFRPRGGGTPHFRPPRGYGHPEGSRFPHPGARHFSGPPPNIYNAPSTDHDHYRSNRHSSQHRMPDRGHHHGPPPRQIFPLMQRMRHSAPPDRTNTYQDAQNYFDSNKNTSHINSMGDIDDRQQVNIPQNRESYQRPSPWANPPPYYDDRSPTKSYRHSDTTEYNKGSQTTPVNAGHRPPASDHYGSNHGSTMDNSNTFSRSVDDTVDIIRKRLLRRESQASSDNSQPNQSDIDKSREPVTTYPRAQQEQPPKRKPHTNQRSRNVKVNCDKIKNKIVDQLFMMDKDKIHKLMDNPNSSSKFEFAINSLVTESQNSFNRHLRSVAEKSLCSSTSTEFIHHDNNTIYEDTFMKQMQCILDPQDTVLLEDIKPMVLAELSKVLQVDNLEQSCVEESSYPTDEQYNQYPSYDYENYQNYEPYNASEDQNDYYEQKPQTDCERPDSPRYGNENITDCSSRLPEFDSTNLFERRSVRKSKDYDESRRISSELRSQERRNIECNLDDNMRRSVTSPPLFNTNPNQLSEEEDDPFAELDKQYHVAVDHNFIENYDISSPVKSISPVIKAEVHSQELTPEKSYNMTPPSRIYVRVPDVPPEKIKEEIDHQLQDMAKSPLKFSPINTNRKNERESFAKCSESDIKQELHNSNITPEKKMDVDYRETENLNAEHIPEPKVVEITEKSQSSSCTVKSSTPCQSRKRSIDQRPSHRKEKRKKSESSPSDNIATNKQILNKNIIINVSDCAATKSEKCDTSKSIFNLYFSKEKNNKDPPKDTVKKVDSVDKGYSDKYVKRKDERKKSRDKDKDSDVKKKHDSSSSSHSMLSPDSSKNQTPTKIDGQTKLKPIDMFVEQPRKPNVHQTHRNSTPSSAVHNKVTVETKPVVISRKLTKRHIATQVARKCISKEVQTMSSQSSTSRHSQTERKKLMTRGAQTEPVSLNTKIKATDAFERMKEIDMEIQALLQEKFKLYNSLESKESGPRTMQSLGMTVLNVTPIDDAHASADSPTGDAIVDEFTNIPVEELEQIALETVEEEIEEKLKNDIEQKKSKRQKILSEERKGSISPATSTTSTRGKKKEKAPNISLIEQIITDDRPLEDIISLDDFEVSPVKTRKKASKQKSKSKKKTTKKRKVSKSCEIVSDFVDYDLKECSVVLLREDLSKYYPILETEPQVEVAPVEPAATESHTAEASEVLEEPVNDIQFDMLDVSEDIVIGDVCEVKCSEDKEVGGSCNPSICEEVILDNSQSSMEEAAGAAAGDECKMYDYSVDENLRRDCVTVSGHADAVLAIECIDNNFVAACLDGNVYYFSSDGQLLSTLRGSNLAVTCLTIVKEKYGTTIYTGSLDSRIRYYDLETGLEKGPECNVLSPIQTMDRAWETVFVGTRTGFVLQFECKNNMLIPVSTVKFSEQSILALRAMKEGPRKVLLVAARSEPVTIKDAQTGLLLRTLEGPKMTVYTLLFEDGKVYCGTSSHLIHVFDYASGSHVGSHEGGKGAVCLRATGGLVFAGCYDGCVYVYREGDPRPLAQLRGPSLMLLSLAVLGSKIIAGYKDRSLYIWKIPLSILQEMIL